MKFFTLISVAGLAQYINEPDWIIIDCRFLLDDTERGRKDYHDAHIPGALYAHLDKDLSGPKQPGKTGRHPLPDVDQFSRKLGSWGISSKSQVIVYDDREGMFAARLWWMLRWLGHETVALLDGGISAWIAEGYTVTGEVLSPEPKIFLPDIQSDMLVSADDVLRYFGDPGHILIDSRSPERFHGLNEPIDPVAGSIPGAINYFWNTNLDARGHFQQKQVLRGRFDALFGDTPSDKVTFYCGSGVTAAHNVLAVVHSGYKMPRLYADSWSEWITDPHRPIVSGI